MCDPLREHTSAQGSVAMRDAIGEIEQTIRHHAALGSRLAGLYLDTAAAPAIDFQRSLQLCSNLAHAYRDVK